MFHLIASFLGKVGLAISAGIAVFHGTSSPPQPVVAPQVQVEVSTTSSLEIESLKEVTPKAEVKNVIQASPIQSVVSTQTIPVVAETQQSMVEVDNSSESAKQKALRVLKSVIKKLIVNI